MSKPNSSEIEVAALGRAFYQAGYLSVFSEILDDPCNCTDTGMANAQLDLDAGIIRAWDVPKSVQKYIFRDAEAAGLRVVHTSKAADQAHEDLAAAGLR